MSKVNMQVKRDFDHPVDRVWGILGNFADLGWCQGMERVEVRGSGPGMERHIHMPGLGAPIEEVLESIDAAARTFSLATVRVEELGAGRCRVRWSATADAQGISGEQAAEILSGVYGQMLGWVADALAKG